jgi:hypothetical protein
LCIEKTWVSCVEDLEKPAKIVDATMPVDTAAEASKAKKHGLNYSELIRKGGNTFVACAQQLNDTDQLNGMGLIGLFSGPEFTEFNRVQVDMNGAEGSVDHFHYMACGKWLEVCKQTLDTCFDTVALERCGFAMQFGSAAVASLTPQSATVAYQDGLARTLSYGSWRLVRNRIGSNFQHTYYPLSFAGLIKLETERQFLDKFARHVRAWWACQDRGQVVNRYHTFCISCFYNICLMCLILVSEGTLCFCRLCCDGCVRADWLSLFDVF